VAGLLSPFELGGLGIWQQRNVAMPSADAAATNYRTELGGVPCRSIDAVYDPEGMSGQLPQFELDDGEQRSGILLKAKEACRIAGKIRDENGIILHRGALISGKLVDRDGNEWQIGGSHGEAKVSEDSKEPEPGPSWSGLPNKYGVQGVNGSSGVFYIPGEGDYDRSEMVFPTRSTFVFPSMKSGHTLITFSPQEEGKKVTKILHDGQDIMKSGIQTKPGQEIKDVTIVIGPQ
jgi:hypothetical protein